MKTIAFFNNKSGVGATTLVYNLAAMFADLGVRVVAVDLDPQASLTAISLPVETLEAISGDDIATIYDVVAPVLRASVIRRSCGSGVCAAVRCWPRRSATLPQDMERIWR